MSVSDIRPWWGLHDPADLDEYLEDLTVVLGGYQFANRIIRREQTADRDRTAADLTVVRERVMADIEHLTARVKGGAA